MTKHPIRISTKPTPEQVSAIKEAGSGAVVHHPLAGHAGRRRELGMALGRAGVPHRLVRSLGWSTTGAPAPACESEAQAPVATSWDPEGEDASEED